MWRWDGAAFTRVRDGYTPNVLARGARDAWFPCDGQACHYDGTYVMVVRVEAPLEAVGRSDVSFFRSAGEHVWAVGSGVLWELSLARRSVLRYEIARPPAKPPVYRP